MPFFTVYVKATGAAYSSTHARAQLADPMPAHLDFVEQPLPPDLDAVMWDPPTLTYIAKPPHVPTRLEELQAMVAPAPGARIYTEPERDEIFKLMIGGTL
jgi:hypothetical protein